VQVELAYFDHGGILQYAIRNLIHTKHWISCKDCGSAGYNLSSSAEPVISLISQNRVVFFLFCFNCTPLVLVFTVSFCCPQGCIKFGRHGRPQRALYCNMPSETWFTPNIESAANKPVINDCGSAGYNLSSSAEPVISLISQNRVVFFLFCFTCTPLVLVFTVSFCCPQGCIKFGRHGRPQRALYCNMPSETWFTPNIESAANKPVINDCGSAGYNLSSSAEPVISLISQNRVVFFLFCFKCTPLVLVFTVSFCCPQGCIKFGRHGRPQRALYLSGLRPWRNQPKLDSQG
jgi:hypothetical protein